MCVRDRCREGRKTWWREHVGVSKAAADSWAREMREEGMERVGTLQSERANAPGIS